MILTHAQAEAVYKSRAAIQRVGGQVKCQFEHGMEIINVFDIDPWDDAPGVKIRVVKLVNYQPGEEENYKDESDFLLAYGLY